MTFCKVCLLKSKPVKIQNTTNRHNNGMCAHDRKLHSKKEAENLLQLKSLFNFTHTVSNMTPIMITDHKDQPASRRYVYEFRIISAD